jgi:hypothetical protein
MVSAASSLSAEHAGSLPRKLDAKTFRGDVSEKFRCKAPRHPTRYFVGSFNLRKRISLAPEVSSSVVPC